MENTVGAEMSRRQTKEDFEHKHPGKKWSPLARRLFANGSKSCTKCGKDLPASEFGFCLTRGFMTVLSACSGCLAAHAMQRLNNIRAEGNREILEDDFCDVCGEAGADWFWRNCSGGEFWNWAGLHKHCIEQARESELIPKRGRVKPKSRLERGK